MGQAVKDRSYPPQTSEQRDTQREDEPLPDSHKVINILRFFDLPLIAFSSESSDHRFSGYSTYADQR
jgi:hypothetical protein